MALLNSVSVAVQGVGPFGTKHMALQGLVADIPIAFVETGVETITDFDDGVNEVAITARTGVDPERTETDVNDGVNEVAITERTGVDPERTETEEP